MHQYTLTRLNAKTQTVLPLGSFNLLIFTRLGYNVVMIISVLHSLENKSDWLSFFRREHPYCLVDKPAVLVDFQSTFLQLTCFQPGASDALRYTLGSRTSLEPAWQLIKGCHWSLNAVVEGLNSLNFNTNVRDRGHFNLPSDLSVRKSFTREPRLYPFAGETAKERITPDSLAELLRNQQYEQLQILSSQGALNVHSLMISLATEHHVWQLFEENSKILAHYRGRPMFALQLSKQTPKRHLLSQELFV